MLLCVKISFCCERDTCIFFHPRETKKVEPEFWLFFSRPLSPQKKPTKLSLVQKKKTMGGKDEGNDSGSDDDIAFADDDNDTKDEETNVESYDSDDENLEEVRFMYIFLYRHHHRWTTRDFWFEMKRDRLFERARLRERERAFKRVKEQRVKEKEKCNEFSSRRAFLSLSFLTLR